MSLKRVFKTASAGYGGTAVNVITQLLLPPVFLHRYDVAGYGEWLTMSAAVAYLGTLNFGLQTYANNQTAICYNRGDLKEAHTIQATALAVLLGIICAAALVSSVIFLVPINLWLGLRTSRAIVSATIYLLGLSILAKILYGFLVGIFLVVGVSHRGSQWSNALALAITLATAAQAAYKVSFAWIAAQQLIMCALFCLLVLTDLRIKAAPIFPRLRYIDLKRMGDVLKPSGYFGMLFGASFLVYQLPIILMQRILGPTIVVVYTLTRTIYSMTRQVLAILSQAIGPEINELYARHSWARLYRLYDLSERVVFACVPVVSAGTMLATPVLMAIWLHKPGIYHPAVCMVLAIISGIMAVKDHKYHFQTCTNEHSSLARLTIWSYLAMVALAAPAMHYYGILGFLFLWLATELYQTFALLHLNRSLFSDHAFIDFSPAYKLAILMAAAMLSAGWFAFTANQRPLFEVLLTALAFVIALAAIAYPLFGLGKVSKDLRSRFGML